MAFPDIEPNGVTITNETPTVINTARSGRQTRFQRSDPALTIAYEYNALSESERRSIIGHHASVGGSLNSFDVNLPTGIKDNSASYTGTLTTNGAHTAGDTTIAVNGSTNGLCVKAGDYIRFASGSNKLYTITADATVSAGTTTLQIFPALLDDVTTGVTVNHTDVTAKVFYQTVELGYRMGPNLFGDITVTFKEDL